MREKITPPATQLNERPIGRFLLTLDEEFRHKFDVYTYAARFSSDYNDILNPNWASSSVAKQEISGQSVYLEFAKATQDSPYHSWRLQAGRDHYELYCNEDECYGMYYELTDQRALMRRRKIGSVAVINTIQGIIEQMTDTREFYKITSDIRGQITRAQAVSAELDSIPGRSVKEDRIRKGNASFLHGAGFAVGSPDISKKVPLLPD